MGDIFTGMMMAFGIMAALRDAEATGKGKFVDVAMYDAMISLCERMVYLHDMTGKVPGPMAPGTANSVEGMTADLGEEGLTIDLAHVYAVYRVSKSGAQRTIYQGTEVEGVVHTRAGHRTYHI